MSVADFVRDVGAAVGGRSDDTALTLLTELARGGLGALHFLRAQPSGWLSCSVNGHTFEWAVDSIGEARRGATFYGERPVAEWLLADLDAAEPLLWDVGAYHGNYACAALAQGWRVHAFEPARADYERLRGNLAANAPQERWTAERRALSDRAAEIGFPESSERTAAVGDGGTVQTATVPGDGILETPDVLKVDVEGHEVAVLDGMAETLGVVERAVVEVHHPDDAAAVRQRLQAAGLKTQPIPCIRPKTFIGGVRR